MNIAFIGSEIKGNFALEICNIRGDNIEYLGEFNHIDLVRDKILEKKYTAMIFDIQMFIDDSVVIANEISKIHQGNNAKVIIYSPGYTIGSELILELVKKNFVNFIFAVGLASKKNELEKCLDGYYETNGINVSSGQSTENIQEPQTNKVFKTIGVCGAIGRIGTTTQCMQIIKFLSMKGYTAAYIEMNTNRYIDMCKALYADIKIFPDSGKVEYASIPMYRTEFLPEVLKSDYDYLIYDFGSFTDQGFQKISFLEKDIQLMICGAKPNEIESTQQLLQSQYYRNVYYMFSFIPETDTEDIKEMMEDRGVQTIFSKYQPDPFVYSSTTNKLYESFLTIEEKENPMQPEKQKRSFFKRGIRNGK